MSEITTSFIDKLIDWKEFEFFIADVYASSDEVKVEHDVTEIGKSNAKRQIDFTMYGDDDITYILIQGL